MEERQGRVDVTRREPRLFLPVREVERLKRVLAESARLTNLDWTRIETFRGPRGAKLHWTSLGDAGWEKLLQDTRHLMGGVLLRLGLHCYALKLGEDRLLIWRQIRIAPPGDVVRMSFFDTTSLQPIGRSSKRRSGDPVIYESGLLAEVDLPTNLEGLQPRAFPHVMAGIPDQHVLVHAIEGWNPRLPKRDWNARRKTIIYAVRPSRSEVEAFPLEWARSVEGRFHWIARVARDSTTGKIVGDGAGVRLFILDNRANFLGWVWKTKA